LLTRGITDNFKTRYFYALEPDKPGSDGRIKPRVLDEFNDDAWVGGPGFYGTGDWLSDGSGIYYLCEKDGFSHVYTATTDGTRHEKLTDGAWETYSVRQSHDGSRWYLISNEGETGSHRLWVMDRDGSNRTVLTPDVGQYRPVFSADEKKIAILRSTLTSPPELYMFDVEEARLSGALTTSTTELYRTFAWLWPEVLSIRGDGGDFRAHIIRPEMFGKRPNGAGVVFIHGAGYLQNVMSWWSYYYREYMFNHFLALNGYTVLNIDYRGSAGYGRDCRTAIHRHMGGRDLDDVIDAARYLVREEGVNEDKVGVYGGSYGGFLTIMALFKYPDVIEAGGAIRSVTDWAHYNHWYTSRILGLPEEDPEAYKQSSPINFVDGFKGGLLMLHGLVDANVLAADVLRLSQVLIEKGKDDWDLVLYPVEGHAFARASSWTDEYKRIFKLFEERLAGK
jgi:dipeptidyl aminopeptidase/acylaminoacyl peptidase